MLERVVTGPYHVMKAVGNEVYALAANIPHREAVARNLGSGAASLAELVGNAADNIVNRPAETAGIALGTYAAMTLLPYLSKKIRTANRDR